MMNIVIPMAGEGSRFKKEGYELPKPLIDVKGKPMIWWAIKSVEFERNARLILICRTEHEEKYKISSIVKGLGFKYDFEFIFIDKLTEGAACTVLKARKFIDNIDPLVLINSDQYIDWNPNHFLSIIEKTNSDGGILTFHNKHPKWSYAEVNDEGYITYVKEKEPISTYATVGLYHFAKGSDFVAGADSMIHKDARVNGEFYVCPVYNEIIMPMNKKILNYPIPSQSMYGLGTPEDLKEFINANV